MRLTKYYLLIPLVSCMVYTPSQADISWQSWSRYWAGGGVSAYDAQVNIAKQYQDYYDYAKNYGMQDGNCEDLCPLIKSWVVAPPQQVIAVINAYPEYYKSMHDAVLRDGLTVANLANAFKWFLDSSGKMYSLIKAYGVPIADLYKAMIKSILKVELRLKLITQEDYEQGTLFADFATDLVVLVHNTGKAVYDTNELLKANGKLSAFAKQWSKSTKGSALYALAIKNRNAWLKLCKNALTGVYSISGATENYKNSMNSLLDGIFNSY